MPRAATPRILADDVLRDTLLRHTVLRDTDTALAPLVDALVSVRADR